MVCDICGKTVEDGAHFCPNCGASLRQGDQYDREHGQREAVRDREAEQAAQAEQISFKNWFGTLLIPLIPVVGGIAYLVMLIAWSVSDRTPASKRNWAKATLLIMVVAFVLLVVMSVQLMKDPQFMQFMQQYMQMFEGVQ